MDFKILLDLRDELTVKKHDPGMLELGFNLSLLANPVVGKALQQKKQAGLSSSSVPGIRSVQFNPIFRTLRLEYDPEAFSPALINDVLTADHTQAESALRQLASGAVPDVA